MCVIIRVREWQLSSVPVQLHSDPLEFLLHCEESGGLWWRTCSIFTIFIIHIPPSTHGGKVSLPLERLCHHTHKPPCVLSNLHIPAVSPWVKALRAQDTGILIKSLWVIRKLLSLITTSHTGQILRQDEIWVCSVGIQSHRSCRVRNTNGLGGKSTQKEIHTHIQTRGHYLYLYLYLLNQQNDLSLGLDSDRRPEVGVASGHWTNKQTHTKPV